MIDIDRVVKIKCDTLSELEDFINNIKEIPEVVIIGNVRFERSEAYRGHCNEEYNSYYMNFNDDVRAKIDYTFSLSNGSMYLDGMYAVNNYNFDKYKTINK